MSAGGQFQVSIDKANAWRTVRRCTPWRVANSRIPRSSRRASRRIASYSSTLDPKPAPNIVVANSISPEQPGRSQHALSHHPGRVAGGANYLCHSNVQATKVGPNTSVTVGPINADIATRAQPRRRYRRRVSPVKAVGTDYSRVVGASV